MTDLDPVAQKLLYSIMQFNKGKWRHHKPHGRNHNEIMVLACLLHGSHPGERLDWRDNPPDFEGELNENEQGLKVSEISALLRVKSPTITPVIRGLEDEGLVKRTMDPEDRRAVRITITEAGRDIIRAAHEERMQIFNRLVEHLGKEDSTQLAELLTKVYTFFDTLASLQKEQSTEGDDTP
ncbi:MarR family winged helix-turn-helix transcriptional regulator [Paenibacillus sp. MABNR03]|uniref:MarR family winged helix-turn-helix transcriptional regulator n=1 Tax=Paenibacillus sp. MABNR03 TaxID=3142626 RepID=UPI003D2A85FB